MTIVKRHYTIKDVDMLITTETIIDSAIANKTYLQSKRSTWADPFFETLKKKIKDAVENFLGVDNAKNLRQATQILLSIQTPALIDLSEVKIQIEEDFKQTPTRKTEILTQLGFKTYYTNARKKDQEALINLLYQFKKNLSTDLKTEIVTKGTAQESLDTIITYTDTLKTANVTQEGNKGTRKETTQEALIEFNQIYDQVISIAKIATKFYRNNQAKKDQFNFDKVSKNLNK